MATANILNCSSSALSLILDIINNVSMGIVSRAFKYEVLGILEFVAQFAHAWVTVLTVQVFSQSKDPKPVHVHYIIATILTMEIV